MNGLQPTRITVFHVLWFCAVFSGALLGAEFGGKHLGGVGTIAGGSIGLLVGLVVGRLPYDPRGAVADCREKAERVKNTSL